MSQSTPTPKPNPRQPQSRLYGLFWAALALAAAGYIGTIIYKPEILGGAVKHPVSSQESNRGERSLSKAMAKLKQLKHNVRRLENEITRLKAIDAVAAKSAKTLDIPPAKVTSRKTARSTAKGPATKVRNSVTDAASNLAAGAAATPVSINRRLPGDTAARAAMIARKSAGKLAARFTNVADKNGTLQNGTFQNGTLQKAKSLKTAALAGQPIAAKIGAPSARIAKSAPLQAARKGIKIISNAKASPIAKTAPGILIGKATQKTVPRIANARKVTRKIKSVKTVAIVVPRKTAKAKAANIQTGSVRRPAPVISFGAPVVKRAKPRRKIAIRLASASSKAELQLNWLALKDRYGDVLDGLGPRYETLGSKANRRYRLLAGPLPSAAQALSICDRFKSGNIPCTVAALKGRRL